MSRPAWAVKLWWWVTDHQYDKLTSRINIKSNGWPVRARIDTFHWWWRELLLERPVKWALCKMYGHQFVPCPRHALCGCTFCNHEPMEDE